MDLDITKRGEISKVPAPFNAPVVISNVKYGDIQRHKYEFLDHDVVILPFILDKNQHMRYVMTVKALDVFTGESVTTIARQSLSDADEAGLSLVKRFVKNTTGAVIKDDENERVFYLGELTQSDEVYRRTQCYAVDLSGMVKKSDVAFKIDDTRYLMKRSHTEVTQSGANDPVLYAAMYLLFTYFND